MPSLIRQLHDKLCRELAQSEQSAAVHCEREARRYGAHPPGHLLRAIAQHAVAMRPRLKDMIEVKQPLGARLGRSVGEALSLLRNLAIDRIVDAERSYRATLLGVRHGLDVARTLREVFTEERDTRAARVCGQLIEERERLVVEGQDLLQWFARNPDIAVHASTSLAVRREPA